MLARSLSCPVAGRAQYGGLAARTGRRNNMGVTIKSKLLAAKRPALLPVIDSKVKDVLGSTNNVWDASRHAFSIPEARLLLSLPTVISKAPVPSLRAADVVVWMAAAHPRNSDRGAARRERARAERHRCVPVHRTGEGMRPRRSTRLVSRRDVPNGASGAGNGWLIEGSSAPPAMELGRRPTRPRRTSARSPRTRRGG